MSAHGGATQECLRSHRPMLSWSCQEQLFRQDVENADDLRLSTKLFKACLADKKKARHPCCLLPAVLYVSILPDTLEGWTLLFQGCKCTECTCWQAQRSGMC